MFTVYILRCSDNKLYKGFTSNLTNRLKRHKEGRVLSTQSRLLVELVYTEEVSTRMEARMREKYFKSGSRRRELAKILQKT